jgi:hypothetical protein
MERRVTEQEMIAGLVHEQIDSPALFCRSRYFRMRFSGTGVSYRPSKAEYVYRSRRWLDPEILDRTVSLPVVVGHPSGGIIDPANPPEVVGVTCAAFARGDEVWCVVRIWNAFVADMLEKFGADTSPAVQLFADECEPTVIDGDRVLVEGAPQFLCHLALVPKGVWSKNGTVTEGVEA